MRARSSTGELELSLALSDDLPRGVALLPTWHFGDTVTARRDLVAEKLHRPLSTGSDVSDHDTVLDAIRTDATTNPGNSGGALVDMNTAVVGVNTAMAAPAADSPDAQSGSTGLSFAVPADQAKRVADQIIAIGAASHT